MHLHASRLRRAAPVRLGIAVLLPLSVAAAAGAAHDHADRPPLLQSTDPVVARTYEHAGDAPRPLVRVVDRDDFPPHVRRRVGRLVAFRLHRHQPDGTTIVDAPIYLVRSSAIYQKAAAALRNNTSNHEYVWCLLAAVLAHEAAHTAPMTERHALAAEAEQLRRCLFGGHLHTGDGWSAGAYLQQVEAKLRKPREHY